MVDLDTFLFIDFNTEKITPEESFTNTHVKKLYESEHAHTAKKHLSVILDAKYENSYLHNVKDTQCQHFTVAQRNEWLKLLQIFEYFFNGTLRT